MGVSFPPNNSADIAKIRSDIYDLQRRIMTGGNGSPNVPVTPPPPPPPPLATFSATADGDAIDFTYPRISGATPIYDWTAGAGDNFVVSGGLVVCTVAGKYWIDLEGGVVGDPTQAPPATMFGYMVLLLNGVGIKIDSRVAGPGGIGGTTEPGTRLECIVVRHLDIGDTLGGEVTSGNVDWSLRGGTYTITEFTTG